MVSAHSHKVSRVSWYSGSCCVASSFAYGAFTLSGWSSQDHSAEVFQSRLQSEPRCARTPVWALSISLAATFEITVVFFSSGYLDVSVHRVRYHTPMYSVWVDPCGPGFPIRISVDQSSLPAPHRFSQAYTSFIACNRQGIHHMHLVT